VALNFSSHAKLAEVVQRLVDADVPLRRLSDHGTHLAVFLWDPDGNDLEPAWDRPVEQWPRYGAEGVEFLDAPFELDERVTAARWGAPAKPPAAHPRQPAFKEDSSWRSPSSGPATWAAASPRARSPADTP